MPRSMPAAELGQRVPHDDVGDVVPLDHVEDVVDVGRGRVHQGAAGTEDLEGGSDAAQPERRQEGIVRSSLVMGKIGASACGW